MSTDKSLQSKGHRSQAHRMVLVCTNPRTTNPRKTIPNATIPTTTNPRRDHS
jgi:hypothetical protein